MTRAMKQSINRSRLSKISKGITLLLLLAPLLFIFWLITTQSGLGFIYQYANDYLPGRIVIEKLEGSLVGSITASKIQYEQNDTLIKVDKLTLQWRPAALLSNSLDINYLYVQSLTIKLPIAETNINDQPLTLPEINLPWRVALDNVVIDDFNMNLSDKPEINVGLKQIKLNVSTLFNKINIKSLTLKTELSQLNIKGQLIADKNYQHKLELDWQTELPNKAILTGKGRIQGDVTALNIHQQVSGPVQLIFNADVHDLLKQLNWQAQATIVDINPDKIWPEWPGQLKGKLVSTGRTESGHLIADVDISQLTGTLRGFPVSLKSRLEIKDSVFNLSHLDVTSANTRFSARGRIDSKLNINWTLNSPDMLELYPDAQGKLQAKGEISGTLSSPELKTSFNGQGLNLPGYKIGNLKGQVDLDLFHWQQVKIKLSARALKLKEVDLQSLIVTADNNNLQIKIHSGKTSALLKVKGQINNQVLQGRIEKADLYSTEFTDWKLQTPATLKLSKDHFLLEPLCWHSAESKLCASLLNKNGIWQSHIEANKLPLILLKPWLTPDLHLQGKSDVTADLQIQFPIQLHGQLHIKLLPGIASYSIIAGEREDLKYHGGEIDITLNKDGLHATTELNLSNKDRFKGMLTLPSVNLFTLDKNNQAIQANVQLNMHNFSLIEALVPEIQQPKGEAAINFKLSGTLAQPHLTGFAQLINGSLRIPRLGLNIEQITLKSQNNNNDQLNFQLTAHSGEGDIKIQGQTQLNSSAGWPTSITIKGNKFEVAHIPVSHLVVSPDLLVKIQKRTIDITGNVDIPFTKLRPKDVTTAAQVSNDTVIIGDIQPIDEKWLINTKVRLSLGERVHFYGFGFEGRFAGSLLLQDEPGQLTKATGEINIPEGRYAAYGQQLTVEHGRLLYTSSPITNPGLDLRAVRKTGEVIAGLKVKGSLKQPQVELFSVPAMGQTDTLAYLLLGRPIENATGNEGSMMAKAALALSLAGGDSLARTLGERFGFDEMRVESSSSGDQASLVIGRYLSPKLYIGYGVGLIESFNTINVRYQISDKWQLKGESGENQGADLLYTFER